MKIVILAAGKGSRLGQKEVPKALAPLTNGQTIIGYQLEKLTQFAPLSSIIIVVGYQKEKIYHFLKEFSDIRYVVNPDYATENTAKSLSRALESVDEDLLWINGDVIFKKELLTPIFQATESCMVVNHGAVGEEEVKYRADAAGRLLEVSKTVTEGQGEALGINLFLRQDLPLLRESLKQCDKQDYFEKGIELCIQKGTCVRQLVIERDACVEIDFPEDLMRANQMLTHWEGD